MPNLFWYSFPGVFHHPLKNYFDDSLSLSLFLSFCVCSSWFLGFAKPANQTCVVFSFWHLSFFRIPCCCWWWCWYCIRISFDSNIFHFFTLSTSYAFCVTLFLFSSLAHLHHFDFSLFSRQTFTNIVWHAYVFIHQHRVRSEIKLSSHIWIRVFVICISFHSCSMCGTLYFVPFFVRYTHQINFNQCMWISFVSAKFYKFMVFKGMAESSSPNTTAERMFACVHSLSMENIHDNVESTNIISTFAESFNRHTP